MEKEYKFNIKNYLGATIPEEFRTNYDAIFACEAGHRLALGTMPEDEYLLWRKKFADMRGKNDEKGTLERAFDECFTNARNEMPPDFKVRNLLKQKMK